MKFVQSNTVAKGRRAGIGGLKRLSPALVGSPSKHGGGHPTPKPRNRKGKR